MKIKGEIKLKLFIISYILVDMPTSVTFWIFCSRFQVSSNIFLKTYLIFMYMRVSSEAITSPEAGVTGTCEPLDLVDLVVWK